MDFERICMMFTMQEPFYGILLSSMERIPDKRISTIAVGRRGNVFKLVYNPDFINQFNTDTILQLLRHEILHVAFNHWSIWEDETDNPAIRHLRNIAADLEVNGYLDRSKVQKEAGGCWAEDIGLDNFLGTREYFRILTKQQQEEEQKQQAQDPQQDCNGGLGGDTDDDSQDSDSGTAAVSTSSNQNQQNNQNKPDNSIQGSGSGTGKESDESGTGSDPFTSKFHTFDDHSMWPDDMSEAEAEQLQQAVEDMLVFAAEECEKSRGEIPGEMKGRIEAIRNKKRPRPVTDWKRHFRRYLGNEYTDQLKKSKKRESKRFPDAAGTRHKKKSNILVAIDTSGSVSMREYNEFFGQIKSLTQTANFHVLECDARIQHEYDFKRDIPQQLHGGGGTDFQPVIDYFLEHRKTYETLVYFTDGYAPIPKNTPKDTLWVVSSNGDHTKSKYIINGAKVAFIPKEQ